MGQSSTRCKHFDHQYLNKQKHLSLTIRCWGVQRLDWGLSSPPIMKTECTSEQTQCKTKQRLYSLVFFVPVMLNVVVDEICAGTLNINPMLITVSVKLNKKSFVSESFRSVLCALYCFFVFCRVLRDNWYLRNIQEDAFEGATGPTVL